MKQAKLTSAGLVLCLGLAGRAAAGELRGRILADGQAGGGRHGFRGSLRIAPGRGAA